MLIIWILTAIMYNGDTTITHYYQFDTQEDCEKFRAVLVPDLKERGIPNDSFCSPRESK